MSEEQTAPFIPTEGNESTNQTEAQIPENVEMVGDNSAMVDMGGGDETAVETAEATQENIYGKYKSMEDFENAHRAAEQKITELSEAIKRIEGGRDQDGEQDGAPSPAEWFAARDIEQIVTSAGFNGQQIADHWLEHGELNEEMYAGLAQQGYGRDVVDTFVRGQHASHLEAQRYQGDLQARAVNMAGGQQGLDNILQWAAMHYSPAERDNLNARMADPRQSEGVMKEVMYDYESVTNTRSSRPMVTSNEPPTPQVTGFTNTKEVLEAFGRFRDTKKWSPEDLARLQHTPQHLLEGVDNQ